jgi:RNA polymerase sigma-70 factor (ECF subfamily)
MSKVEKDDNWVERLKSVGNSRDQAIAELREILVRGLAATCRNRYDGRVQAEDVVQDALIKVLDKLETFEGRSKFTTWAMTIAVRIAISEMRRKHFKIVSIESLVGEGMSFEPTAVPEKPQVDQGKRELLVKLKELIQTNLSDKQRDAVHALLHGMPVEVFAEKTGSNRNAIYKLVHDARVKLRKGFEQAGYQADDVNTVFA